jgi:hypothetical protein
MAELLFQKASTWLRYSTSAQMVVLELSTRSMVLSMAPVTVLAV